MTLKAHERVCVVKYGTVMYCDRNFDWWDHKIENFKSYIDPEKYSKSGNIDCCNCYACLEMIMAKGEAAARRYEELEVVHANSTG